nr:GntR family transcriptional regulator [Streptomyces sp. NBC_00830]
MDELTSAGHSVTGQALADRYGVSADTVRRAVGDLRERGLVATLPAKGTYVL